jgi:DNA helicase-2/ATP-dependent DNA helicase PcrA
MATVKRRRVVESSIVIAGPDQLVAGLNDEQRAVVTAGDGPIQVLAGAGAGKTKALVNRIAYLITVRGVAASEILAVTFSKKAAEEMNKRLQDLGIFDARVGTWHSLCLEILREDWDEFTQWTIDERDAFKVIVKDLLGWGGGKGMAWEGVDLGVVLSFIGLCKAELAAPGSDKARDIANEFFKDRPCAQTNPGRLCEAYKRAAVAQTDRRLLTFDDFLFMAHRLLSNDEDARQKWAGRFSYVLQDEAQDANFAQIEISRILAARTRNYMIVGDPAQSIYGFRGSRPELFAAFPEEWEGTTVIRMFRNYRSGAAVIDAANATARHMVAGSHLGVDMATERSDDARINVVSSETADEEGEAITRNIQERHADGFKWREMAVLFRTNSLARGIEECLLSARIPYVILGGTNFYDRKEIRDLLAYLRVADGRGSRDDFRRCINTPFRYLGKVFVEKVQDPVVGETWIDSVKAERGSVNSRQAAAIDNWISAVETATLSIAARKNFDLATCDIDNARQHFPSSILERIIKETGYMEFITKDEGAETAENNRVSNVRELVRAASKFTTVGELLDYIDRTIAAARESARRTDVDRVVLCSIHRAKGLEWRYVAVIGCNEKILPHSKATDVEEERRLFYVAVTRARDALDLSCVRAATSGGNVIAVEPSRFIGEAGLAVAS